MSGAIDREALGRRVRELWVEHKPASALRWEDLWPRDRELVVLIAEQIAREAAAAERAACAAIAEREADGLGKLAAAGSACPETTILEHKHLTASCIAWQIVARGSEPR